MEQNINAKIEASIGLLFINVECRCCGAKKFLGRYQPMKSKVALITGITGQDGSYLAELLLEKGYMVHGVKRRSSGFNTRRIDHILKSNGDGLRLHYGDMTDSISITKILQRVQPDEIYNLAAQSHVQVSFESPEYTANCDAIGALRILESMRMLELTDCKFYQASTSELYGNSFSGMLDETTPFKPCSPYAVAKLYAYWTTINFRQAYGIFASNGILFNHESPRRSGNFVTRKITRGLTRIASGLEDCIYLGNLNSMRDWGHARDYVYAMWKILQHDQPDDFVIATGRQESIRKFCEISAERLGWGGISWQGEGLEEIGKRKDNGKTVIRVDKKYFRPSEVNSLLGNSAKAAKLISWKASINLEDLIDEMIQSDLAVAKQETKIDQVNANGYLL